jgi:hypothetical protein
LAAFFGHSWLEKKKRKEGRGGEEERRGGYSRFPQTS